MGPKSFEQCAGFLKIPESSNPLDNSWVHPENYETGKIIYDVIHKNEEVSGELRSEIKTKYNIGDQTINDIIEELKKPNRDPREDCPKLGVLAFYGFWKAKRKKNTSAAEEKPASKPL